MAKKLNISEIPKYAADVLIAAGAYAKVHADLLALRKAHPYVVGRLPEAQYEDERLVKELRSKEWDLKRAAKKCKIKTEEPPHAE